MKGKLEWYQSVVEVNLTEFEEEEEDVSGVLAELGSMPSLRSLSLPSSCAEGAVDAEAVCGLTTLCFHDGVVGEWVLDLSRLPSLTALHLAGCTAVTDKEAHSCASTLIILRPRSSFFPSRCSCRGPSVLG
jgi:hypothetical protein